MANGNLLMILRTKYGSITIMRARGRYSLVDLKVKFCYRRKGHGTELVKLAMETAKSLGIEWISVRAEDTAVAKAFWKNFNVISSRGKVLCVETALNA